MNGGTRREFFRNAALAGGSLAGASLAGTSLLGASLAASPLMASLATAAEAAGSAAAGENDPGVAQAAWRELVALLRDADMSFIDRRRGTFDANEMAYGYRNLTDIVSFAADMYMVNDPDWPIFVRLDTPTKKLLGGNPDTQYLYAPVRGDRRYKISGRRGDEAYMSLTSHRGDRNSGLMQRFDDNINWHKIKTDAEGRFEIIASAEREGENWLHLSPDASIVLGRTYVMDRERDRPATFKIEPLDAPAPPPRPTPEEVAARLRSMTIFIKEVLGTEPMLLPKPNVLGEQFRYEAGGNSHDWATTDNIYAQGGFALAADEALLIEGTVVPCDYWGIQVWNPFLVSPDYRHHRVSINKSQARIGPDGAFRVAVALQDPQITGLDCITTAGERQGQFFIRWLVSKAPPPKPTVKLVKIADLRT
jgi:hypothetical protein